MGNYFFLGYCGHFYTSFCITKFAMGNISLGESW